MKLKPDKTYFSYPTSKCSIFYNKTGKIFWTMSRIIQTEIQTIIIGTMQTM